MKKVLMLLLVLFCLFQMPKVKAQTYKLTLKRQDGIYYVRKGGSLSYKSSQFSIYMFDDNIAYCIEPSKNIETWNYVSTNGYIDLPYSDETKEELELIGYYGREYPGHDNVRYSMAAQALIWEKTGYNSVTFWTEKDGHGEEIDVTREREEIMGLVNKHKLLPNLPNKITGYVNKELVIKDSNNVLNNFKIVTSEIDNVNINNNSLQVIPKKIGESKIVIERDKYDNLETLIFVGESNSSTQTLGRLRFSDKQQKEIKVDVEGIKLLVQKVDEENKPVKISKIGFKIKNLTTNEYVCENNDCVFYTNGNGTFLTSPLPFGKYQIEEVQGQIIKGFIVNKEKKTIDISENSNIKWSEANKSYINVAFSNKKIPTQLTIYKRGEEMISSNNKITYRVKMLSDIEFNIFNEDHEFVKTVKTNSNGTVVINDLPIGTYHIEEKTKRNDYVENNNVYSVTLKHNNPNATTVSTWIIIENTLKKGNVEISKVDYDTKNPLSNTIIALYDDKDNLILTEETDTNGKIIIENLSYGKYYLKEIKANDLYELNNEKINFVIKSNQEINKIAITNKKIVGNLEIFKKGEKVSYKENIINYENISLNDVTFKIYDEKDNLIKSVKTDNNGYVKVNNLPLGKYYIKEENNNSNYQNNPKKYSFEIKKDENNKAIDVKLNIYNYLKKGSLSFIKVDGDTNALISNTLIGIYDMDNKLLLSKKTNNKGKIIIENLPIGKYYLKELESNYYYQKSDEKVNFEIKENIITEKELANKKIVGSLEVFKKGENYHFINGEIVYEEKLLHGIEFNLFNENNELIKTIRVNDKGYVKVENLPLGKYYLIEKTKLDNYQDNNQKYEFEIKKNSDNKAIDVKLEINNYVKKGTFKFLKKDNDTGTGIKDTIMEIYDQDNRLLLTKKTDDEGKIVINNLPFGKYYLKEKEANYYYQKSDKIVTFEINDNGKTITKEMTNQKIVGNLEITKYGEKPLFSNNEVTFKKDVLKDISFELYDENNNLIKKLITDNSGYIKVENLLLGKYYIIEKTKLDNYQDNNQKYEFEIKKNSDNKAIDVKLEINNYLKKSTFKFLKKDNDTGTGIKDTIMEIYDQDNRLLLTKKTDDEGKILINNLPFGKYYLKEKEANYYYQKSDKIITFEINDNGKTITKEMTNQKIVGSLEINKYGEKPLFSNNEVTYEKTLLENISFNLYDENNSLIRELVTDKNGYIKVEGLPLGKYYVIENNVDLNYIENSQKYFFEIKKDLNKAIDVKLEINNYLKKGNLKFSKEDLVTSIGIPNTVIEVYDENDSLLLTKNTDEEGKIIINELPLGKYYIIEKEANELYQITNEKVFFEIKENGEIVKAKMVNEKKEVPVPKTGSNSRIVINSLSSIGIFFSLGWYYYERKETV